MRDDREALWSAPSHAPLVDEPEPDGRSKTVIWATKRPTPEAQQPAVPIAPDNSNRDVQSARASVAAGAIAGLIIGATGHNALDELLNREKPGSARPPRQDVPGAIDPATPTVEGDELTFTATPGLSFNESDAQHDNTAPPATTNTNVEVVTETQLVELTQPELPPFAEPVPFEDELDLESDFDE